MWGIWANKTRRADLDTPEKLANALDVPAVELIAEAVQPEQAQP